MVWPEKMTWVPELSPVRSRVLPAGTAMSCNIMVEQDFFPAAAAAAEVNVQDARGTTSAAGAANAAPALRSNPKAVM